MFTMNKENTDPSVIQFTHDSSRNKLKANNSSLVVADQNARKLLEMIKAQKLEIDELKICVSEKKLEVDRRSRIIKQLLSKMKQKDAEISELKDNLSLKSLNHTDSFAQKSLFYTCPEEVMCAPDAAGTMIHSLNNHEESLTTIHQFVNNILDALEGTHCSPIMSPNNCAEWNESTTASAAPSRSKPPGRISTSTNELDLSTPALDQVSTAGARFSPRSKLLHRSLNCILSPASSCDSLYVRNAETNRSNLVEEICHKVSQLCTMLSSSQQAQTSFSNALAYSFTTEVVVQLQHAECMTDADVVIFTREEVDKMQHQQALDKEAEIHQHYLHVIHSLQEEKEGLQDQGVELAVRLQEMNQQITQQEEHWTIRMKELEEQCMQSNDIHALSETLLKCLQEKLQEIELNWGVSSNDEVNLHEAFRENISKCLLQESDKMEGILKMLSTTAERVREYGKVGQRHSHPGKTLQPNVTHESGLQLPPPPVSPDAPANIAIVTKELEKEREYCKRLLKMQADTNSKLQMTVAKLSSFDNEVKAKNQEVHLLTQLNQQLRKKIDQFQASSSSRLRFVASSKACQTEFTAEHWLQWEQGMAEASWADHPETLQEELSQTGHAREEEECISPVSVRSGDGELHFCPNEIEKVKSKLQQYKERYRASVMEYDRRHQQHRLEMENSLSSVWKLLVTTREQLQQALNAKDDNLKLRNA